MPALGVVRCEPLDEPVLFQTLVSSLSHMFIIQTISQVTQVSAMKEAVYQQYILDTIDHLRHRKARPDSDRIFHSLTKKYALSYGDAKTALERAVQNGSVLRVEYKGNISYRNAARKVRRESNSENFISAKNGRKFTGLVTNAIAELVLQEPDYLQWGVPANELVKNILSKDSVKYTKKYVSILLDKEVEVGGLIKMENGNFLVGPTKPDIQVAKATEPENATLRPEEPDVLKIRKKPGPKPGPKYLKVDTMYEDSPQDNPRVGGRRKNHFHSEPGNQQIDDGSRRSLLLRREKAKKVFDPSDTNIPRKRGRPAGSLNKSTIEKQLAKMSDSDSRPESRTSLTGREGGVCSVCHLQNKKGPNEKLISCRECSNKAHISCLNNGDMMLRMYPDNTWQCPHCKTCALCFETGGAVLKGPLAVCSVCADAYHKNCHEPKLTDKTMNENKWKCKNCLMPDELVVNDIQIGYNKVDMSTTAGSEYSDEMIVDDRSRYSESSSRSHFNSSNSTPTPPMLTPPRPAEKDSPFSEHKFNILDAHSMKEEYLEENIDPSIPDASNWTYDEVYAYFRQFFPEEEAKIFKEQEIDGRSLLLLRRNDIIQCFKLRLGSALKIFKHVIKLQYRRDDPRLYWL